MGKNPKPEEISPEEKAKMEEKKLPQFRERKKGEDQETPNQKEKEDFGPGTDKELPTEYVLEVCKELAEMGGKIWHSLDPVIPELEPSEAEILYKPMARMAQKYRAGKYLKDEILLLGGIIFIVGKRLRIKKNADHDRGEKGKGKDQPGEKDHPV